MNSPNKVDMWRLPAKVEANGFKYKSLCNWVVNTAVGCSHGCHFCYVPSITNWQREKLSKFGVQDPDSEWGEYALLREWNPDVFCSSLAKAANTPLPELKPDGNRAIMFSSTTDPYQAFNAGSTERTRQLNLRSEQLVRRCLELICHESKLNVRILTRSPLAKQHFDLFKAFGDRLVFGMSLPTLNDKLSRVYEPNAPGPKARLRTLLEAREAGLNVYVALAPTYPECDEADIETTLKEIRKLDPVTVFHEPINIRAENVRRIEQAAKRLGVKMNLAVYATPEAWMKYAVEQLLLVQRLAARTGLSEVLHLWPDHDDLSRKKTFLSARKLLRADLKLDEEELKVRAQEDAGYYEKEYLPWLQGWWNRVSEWPGQKRAEDFKIPALIDPFKQC